MPTERQMIGRYGALLSWSRTPDRSARTRPARAKAPSSVEYHLERLDPELFTNATETQRLAAAEAAKKAYFAHLAMRSAAVRRGGGDAVA